MTDFQKSKLPFNIVSSSVNTGYITEISSGFKPGVDIVGHHQDTYAGLENEPVQTTFTRTHVGGNEHRHTPINTGIDNDFNRAEAFKIKPESQTLKIYGPDFEDVNKPRSQMWHGAKSPINISNIKSDSNLAGNFEKNYQVVQTSGRGITNNLIVDGFEASGVLTTQFIAGTSPYSLPDLSNNSKSIFVERFNAPGGKQESSRGVLERYGEELSPNNSLTTRNIKVRQPFYSQLTQHSPQFGSGSVEGVSVHKVNRNPTKSLFLSGSEGNQISSGSRYDNFWVQHNIPATQFGYAWVTSSTISNPYTIGTASLEFDITGSVSNTKDKIISLDTQTIIGSLSSSDSYYSTWKQIRTGEHPVARKLRETNIIAVQDPPRIEFNALEQTKETKSFTSTNFKDPPVTSKNHPLIQEVVFSGSLNNSPTTLKYTFKNNSTWFANEELDDRLSLVDKDLLSSKNYSMFYKKMVDAKNNTFNSPIQDVLFLTTKQTLYPREVNTYLSGTRNRIHYILDQPGFDRDGYDRQLGTQRVFWRDNQEDRRRSPNSEGGHINSLGYSSLEESGSSISEYKTGVYLENYFEASSSYVQNNNIDKGFHNSILFLEENKNLELEMYRFNSRVKSAQQTENLVNYRNISTKIKRSFISEVNSQNNESFIDFYEHTNSGSYNKSIGALYRNTTNKHLLTSIPASTSSNDLITLNEEDEINFNPKPRYVSFLGGGELNTSDYIINSSSNYSISVSGTVEGDIYSIEYSGSDVYCAGTFTSISGIPIKYLAKYDTIKKQWNKVSDQIDFSVDKIKFSGSYLYIFAATDKTPVGSPSRIIKWNFKKYDVINQLLSDAFSAVFDPFVTGNPPSISDAEISGSDWYITGRGGSFRFATNNNNRNIVKWNSALSNWEFPIQNISVNVHCIAKKDDKIYFGKEENIIEYNTSLNTQRLLASRFTYSTSGSPVGTPSQVTALFFSGSDLYFSGDIRRILSSSVFYPINRIGKWDGTTWTDVNTDGQSLIFNKFIIDNTGTIYGAGVNNSIDYQLGGGGFAKYNNDTTWTQLNTSSPISGFGCYCRSITDLYLTGNNIYFSTKTDTIGGFSYNTEGDDRLQGVGYYNILDNTFYGLANDIGIFCNDYFEHTSSINDFYISTLDNGLVRDTENISNKIPFYDSSEEYYKTDIYQAAKEYSVIPEYKISEHIKYHISSSIPFGKNNSLFSIDGAAEVYSSANNQTSSFNTIFFQKYINSDVLIKNNLESDYSELTTDSININIKGIKKLLPYNGFYPQDRTLQISNLYNEYIENVLDGGLLNISTVIEENKNYLLTSSISASDEFSRNIEIVKFQDKYYLASSFFDDNKIRIYSSSNIDLFDFSETPIYTIDIEQPSSGFTSIYNTDNEQQRQFKFINQKDLLLSLYYVSSSDYLSVANTNNGTLWITQSQIPTNSSGYLSGAFSLDAYYDQNNDKIFITCGRLEFIPFTGNGKISLYTSSFVDSEFSNFVFSDEIILEAGIQNVNGQDYLGDSLSFLSCSNSYHIYFTNYGNGTILANTSSIFVISSSDGGVTWSDRFAIATYNDYNILKSYGSHGLSPIEFNNKIYVFCVDHTTIGGASVVTSSDNSAWYSGSNYGEYNTFVLTEDYNNSYKSPYSNNDSKRIRALKTEDQKCLYFSFATGRCNFVGGSVISKLYIGYTYDGNLDNKSLKLTYLDNSAFNNLEEYLVNSTTSSFNSIACALRYDSDNIPYFSVITDYVSGSDKFITSFDTKQITNISLDIENSNKKVKQAALEPVMSPGILYNSIKSGIAVDWPCATGSQVTVRPYDNESLINIYYPQSFKMFEYNKNNYNFSMYGSLRSNIDYRVNFEKLLFPDNIFPVKNQLTASLIKKIPSSNEIDSNEQIIQFISGCYIYGGYEPYMSPSEFSDYNELGPKRFSIPFVYRKQGASDNGLYSMAMSNFLAETVNFFLKDRLLTAFTSNPDLDWGVFDETKTYYMDIVVSKTPDLVMMEAYHDDKHPTGSFGEKMNGRYFGYPVNKTNKELWSQQSDSLLTSEEARLIHNDPAYAPYTPPYFEGTARARLSFTPPETKNYRIDEIFSNLVVEEIFDGVARGAHTGSDAYLNKMSIRSSINLKGTVPWVSETVGDVNSVTPDPNINSWVIGTRFECPVLDFSSQQTKQYQNNYSKTSGYGRGMWSGYGTIPEGQKGIYISLEESFPQENIEDISTKQSLLRKVGFDTRILRQKIGVLAENKIIKEAIMVIPFIERISTGSPIRSEPKTLVNSGIISRLSDIEKELGIEFILLRRDMFERFKEASEKQEQIASSILDTINKMKQFIVPPQLDYVNNQTIDPYVAYILEFEHELSQQDLADIWQGVSPRVARIAEHIQSTISHPNSENEFFHGFGMPDDVKFMIFKIKQKGEFDYFKVTKDSTDDQRFRFEQTIGRGQNKYSYNWPYDFYSLVELAKVDVEIKYKKRMTNK